MVERVDKVEGQIMTVRSTLKTEAYLAVDYKSQQLKTEIMWRSKPKTDGIGDTIDESNE